MPRGRAKPDQVLACTPQPVPSPTSGCIPLGMSQVSTPGSGISGPTIHTESKVSWPDLEEEVLGKGVQGSGSLALTVEAKMSGATLAFGLPFHHRLNASRKHNPVCCEHRVFGRTLLSAVWTQLPDSIKAAQQTRLGNASPTEAHCPPRRPPSRECVPVTDLTFWALTELPRTNCRPFSTRRDQPSWFAWD